MSRRTEAGRALNKFVALAALVIGAVAAVSAPSDSTASADTTELFVPLAPARVLDTRGSAKVGDAAGTGAPYVLKVLGKGGVPASGVGAVALNVTVTQTENPTLGGGYVTVYPCGTRPDASNLNFVGGQTIPNSVIAPVSENGDICFYVYGTAHLIADVSGYFARNDVGPPQTVTCGGVSPAQLGFDPFYVTYCNAAGLAVLGSARVDPRAVQEAARIALGMIGHRPDLIAAMRAGGVRVGVIGTTEVTSDMPEYRNIYTQFPGTDWDNRARGLGATSFIPLSSVGEENLLCLPGDRYAGESIMVHEFAHTIVNMGLDVVVPAFWGRVERAYAAAVGSGRWLNTYAGSNATEYFAEAVQTYFDTNLAGPVGGDGIHNDVNTRAELAVYDPELFGLVDEVFGGAAPSLGLC